MEHCCEVSVAAARGSCPWPPGVLGGPERGQTLILCHVAPTGLPWGRTPADGPGAWREAANPQGQTQPGQSSPLPEWDKDNSRALRKPRSLGKRWAVTSWLAVRTGQRPRSFLPLLPPPSSCLSLLPSRAASTSPSPSPLLLESSPVPFPNL